MKDEGANPKHYTIQSSHLDEEIRTETLARAFAARNGAGNGGNHGAGGGGAGDGEDRGTLMSPRRKRPLPRGIFWGAIGLVALFVIGFGASYVIARHELAATVAAREGSLRAGVEDLGNFDLNAAEKDFSSQSGTSSGWFGAIASFFSGGSNAFGAWNDLSGQMLSLTQDIANAQDDLWSTLAAVPVGNGGTAMAAASSSAASSSPATATSTGNFVDDLKNIRTSLAAIDSDMGTLSDTATALSAAGVDIPQGDSTDYLGFRTEIEGAEKFLDAFIPWFADASSTHHVLVLLENPSEMRPGGGFIGSYADVSVRGGAITGVAVHDIADADAGFGGKIVPPAPLMLEETGWRPADGNWFFDFPTSASQTVALFEQSAPYAASSTTFDAAVALTPQAMTDVLSVTGPVLIPDAALGIVPAKRGVSTSTSFTADNLTQEIQAVVQAGQAKAVKGSSPKSVIGLLWQNVLSGIASAGQDEKADLLSLAAGWINNKDVMAYAKDPAMESFLQTTGAAGDEFRFPQNFNGDYLAVANTDVNSDKSELYVSSTVAWTVQLGADGIATDHVDITRTHHGDKAPRTDWWYRTTNQDYLELFVPAGSTLVNESGGFVKKVPAPINYMKNGYSTDPLIAAMESSTVPFFSYPAVAVRGGSASAAAGTDPGKTVFSVWDRTYAASSTQVVFDYSHPLHNVPADGMQYEFVIERPSGATGDYRLQVDAPLGYVFAENNLASFTYNSTSTPGRLVFDLTLQKI